MMTRVMMILFYVHAASAVKHSLKFHLMLSFEVPNVPEYMAMESVEGVMMAYYDSNIKTGKPQEWVQEIIEKNPEHWETQVQNCIHYQQVFKVETQSFKQASNQTEGGHIIQQISGCEWDDVTQKVDGFKKYAYNGEDFVSFDMDTETWITLNPHAEVIKREWDQNTLENGHWKNLLSTDCLAWLKMYLNYAKSILLRKDLPSVSLLQKTSSSPVSCHATGFYPDKAVMFWRKDGEEIHDGVEHGEILQNHDGTFQMRVELNISSVTPEDWRRYECVFQLAGVQNDIITKLDELEIRTNFGKNGNKNSGERNIIISAVILVVIIIIIITVVGFVLHKKKKAQTTCPENTLEASERLNPENRNR